MNTKKKKIKTYVGSHLVNSRITVDYSGEKPKVEFGYPPMSEKDKDSSSMATIVPLAMALSLTAVLILSIVLFFTTGPRDYPTNCTSEQLAPKYLPSDITITCDTNAHGKMIRNLTFYLPKGEESLFDNPNGRFIDKTYSDKEGTYRIIILSFLIIILMFFFTLLLNLLHKRFGIGGKVFPKVSAFGGKKYVARFDTCPDSKVIELPLFKDIQLDYRATEEFSKYLVKVEIREHPFMEFERKLKHKTIEKFDAVDKNGTESRVTWESYDKKKPNQWLWYARFYFKEVPKSGFLEIRWK